MGGKHSNTISSNDAFPTRQSSQKKSLNLYAYFTIGPIPQWIRLATTHVAQFSTPSLFVPHLFLSSTFSSPLLSVSLFESTNIPNVSPQTEWLIKCDRSKKAHSYILTGSLSILGGWRVGNEAPPLGLTVLADVDVENGQHNPTQLRGNNCHVHFSAVATSVTFPE